MSHFPNYWPTSADAVWQVKTPDNWSIAVHVYGDPNQPRPAVALFHGALSNSRSYDVAGYGLAPWLREQGFNAFAVDFRGRGYSLVPPGRSGWTIDDFIQHDVPSVVGAIRQRCGVESVHCIGHSLGGLVLLGYLALGGEGIDRVVTLGSSVVIDSHPILEWLERIFGRSAYVPLAVLGERAGFLSKMIPQPLWSWCASPEHLQMEHFRRFVLCGTGNISMRKIRHLKRICDERRFVSADGSIDYASKLWRIKNPIRMFAAKNDTLISAKLIALTQSMLSGAPSELIVCGRDAGFSYDYGHLDMAIGTTVFDELFPKIGEFFRARPSISLVKPLRPNKRSEG